MQNKQKPTMKNFELILNMGDGRTLEAVIPEESIRGFLDLLIAFAVQSRDRLIKSQESLNAAPSYADYYALMNDPEPAIDWSEY